MTSTFRNKYVEYLRFAILILIKIFDEFQSGYLSIEMQIGKRKKKKKIR